MVRLAKTEAKIVLRADRLDSDPSLLNCRNGTLDLKTGEKALRGLRGDIELQNLRIETGLLRARPRDSHTTATKTGLYCPAEAKRRLRFSESMEITLSAQVLEEQLNLRIRKHVGLSNSPVVLREAISKCRKLFVLRKRVLESLS